jgi:hypothetical protein
VRVPSELSRSRVLCCGPSSTALKFEERNFCTPEYLCRNLNDSRVVYFLHFKADACSRRIVISASEVVGRFLLCLRFLRIRESLID